MAQQFIQKSIVVLLCVILAGIALWAGFNRDKLSGLAVFARQELESTTPAVTGVSIGGPFQLVDQDGQNVTDQSYKGKIRLMFFGFTHCPDVCPTKLTSLQQVMDKLGPYTAHIVPIFISVDPERDTVPVMKSYVHAFSDQLVGLTGTQEQVLSVIKSYRVYAQKTSPDTAHELAPDSKDYTVDHSAFTYIMGPDNEFLDVMSYELTPDDMFARIKPFAEKYFGP